MNRVAVFSGGAKVPELETLTREINEFSQENNVAIERVEIISHITLEKQKGEEQPVQVITPVALVTYKHV